MKAILVDVTRCTGCERCVAACIEENGTDPVKAQIDRAVTKDGLSENRFLSVPMVEEGRFVRLSCMHCLEPACVSACLVGGITKTPDGPVIYDPDKCIGCRYCMLACPFHIPRYEWDAISPFMRKCALCHQRLAEGGLPACVEACPQEALRFGDRKALLLEAHGIIAAGRGRYLDRVWGEHEFGGTSVLYVSDVDLGVLGWPSPATVSIPSLTEPLIAKTPFIGLGVMGSLLGINWVIRRRMRLAGEAGGGLEADDSAEAMERAAGSGGAGPSARRPRRERRAS
jgi:formate dehydrogenase iron-sulfur subunit